MNDDDLDSLAVLIIGIAALLVVLMIAGLVWFIVSTIVAAYLYRQYLREAEDTFDEVAQELGVDLPVDDVLRATYAAGVDLPENGGYETVADWMTGTPMGVSQ